MVHASAGVAFRSNRNLREGSIPVLVAEHKMNILDYSESDIVKLSDRWV
jgi:hypothetical protein